MCEKPLAMTADESGDLVRLAAASGLVNAVNFNIRFYPLNQHVAGFVRDGGVGDVRLVTGRYFQDWLLYDTDWNWRLEPERGGALRAVGDIGSHWLDLTTFLTGQRVQAVMADLTTFIPVRYRPTGPVETFSTERAADTVPVDIRTEDVATVLLRFENGARGQFAVSQLSPGRKNSLHYEIDGTSSAVAWDSEQPEQLWIGHRDRPNELLLRNPALMNALGGQAARLPGGHVEGFFDTFGALVHGHLRGRRRGTAGRRAALPDVRGRARRDAGRRRDRRERPHRPPGSTWSAMRSPRARPPVLRDDPRTRRPRHGGFASMKLGFLTAPFPDTPLMDVADWAAGAGFEVLEIACWPRSTGPTRRYAGHQPHRRRQPVRRPGHRDPRRDRGQGPLDLRARLLPQPAPPGPRAPRDRSSATSSW